jgi:hypothetical protein
MTTSDFTPTSPEGNPDQILYYETASYLAIAVKQYNIDPANMSTLELTNFFYRLRYSDLNDF